jgi:hypothetical protein
MTVIIALIKAKYYRKKTKKEALLNYRKAIDPLKIAAVDTHTHNGPSFNF